MTSETHPTAVQTASVGEIFRTIAEISQSVDRLKEDHAQAIRERDEAIALLRYVRDYSNDPGVVARVRAFLSNFSEEDAE